ncbi:iron complex transport system substrate-binding protein [Sedimentibacter acidaminivorans]|uniref:Iron complex transport system substrate-binding protein n=1 Tax=Sedimentibacter acidaminivorans TaxID=913099 RepID=A0ABS4GEP6_9FIRM|nr:ABC transporter substrate-binding protein [Sedimentibacter acidaminivorans]MBP1926159.1 iron complex transport system substrate-binding protein [Sedimentibacter acidaminivorans]
MNKTKFLALLIIALMLIILITGCSKNNSGDATPETSAPSTENTEVSNKEENNASETPENNDAVSEYGVTINDEDVTFEDYTGEMVTIKKNPERVVCLYNSYLDIYYSCGGEVVGRVKESEEKPVEESLKAEVVGTSGAPSLEKVLELQPELVIMTSGFSGQTEMIPTLKENNIQVIAIKNDYLEDYYKSVRLFTAITGREDLYQEQMDKVKKGVDKIVEKAPTDKKYKVLILFASAKSLTVRNSESMVGEMLKDLNTINISDTQTDPSNAKVFSMEKIIQEDPDFIFVQTMGSDHEKIMERLKSDAEDNPAWASLKAVKNDKYIVLPKDLYMYKPNDRYPEAYKGLAEILYLEVYK